MEKQDNLNYFNTLLKSSKSTKKQGNKHKKACPPALL